MLNIRRRRRAAAGAAGMACIGVVMVLWLWGQAHSVAAPEVPTGASFNIPVARVRSEQYARTLASRIEASGLPAFTRTLSGGAWRQVIVGPYVSIDEAEGAQRLLAARGLSYGRLLVDESVRRVRGAERPAYVEGSLQDTSLVLVAGAGRVSVVFEMPAEPRRVVAHRSAGTIVDVDVGPVTSPVPSRIWNGPPGMDLVNQVSVEEFATAGERYMRTRVALAEFSYSNVRVVGRRVYIDLWSPETPQKTVVRPQVVRAARVEPEAEEDGNGIEDYQNAIRTVVARFEAIEPFLLAAVASPEPEVLAALAGTLGGLDAWIRTIEPPPEWAGVHGSLVGAVGLATRAVEPGFEGDRAAQAREASGFIRAIRHQRLSL